jgi:hypothetical protein
MERLFAFVPVRLGEQGKPGKNYWGRRTWLCLPTPREVSLVGAFILLRMSFLPRHH